MDNQHEKIKGYRDLSQSEIDLMNEIKATAEKVGELVESMESITCQPGVDTDTVPNLRWMAIAKTDLQKGFMALVRSVAKPTTF